MRRCREAGLPARILGRGTNLLVADQGVEGAVISTAGLQGVAIAGDTVTADCGVGLPRLVALAAERGLSGLERLAGIPGSLGGAIRMNAGAADGCIGDVVEDVLVITPGGDIATLDAAEIGFGYRCSGLDGAIVVSATLSLHPSGRERVLRATKAHARRKKMTQPTGKGTAGCVFKNPPSGSAGGILDRLGLKGARAGGAKVSEKHANFIVNSGRASADDVMALIGRAREAVFRTLGIELDLEIEIWPSSA